MAGQSVLVFARLLVLALLATAGNVTIPWVYPNPATHEDAGEFVVLDGAKNTTLAGYTLSDGEREVALPPVTVDGPVVLTDDPRVATAITAYPVVRVDPFLSLSNGGDSVALRHGNRTVATLSYSNAPEAERFDGTEWQPPGRTRFPTVSSTDVTATAFALPDTNRPIYRTLDRAEDRILLGGYTFTDPNVADRLIDAKRRGVEVAVLVEGGPVGGVTTAQRDQLDRLHAGNVTIDVMTGARARYDFHHAKYAVVDDTAIVTSENWKPGGVGGHGSRGWGLRLRDRTLADHLARVFAADATWNDTNAWPAARPSTLQPSRPDNASFPRRFDPTTTSVDSATVLLAPDNANDAVRDVLRNANKSIRIQQVSIDRDGPLLGATLAAARRGVDVKILLSGAWYVEEDNRALAADVRRRARAQDLPVEIRLVEPRSRFEHVHNKGVIVDGRRTVVGSLNWNRHSFEENREVAVLIEDERVARYYERIFRADWRGAAWRIHWGLIVVTGLVVAGAIGIGSVVASFGDRENGDDRTGRW